METLLIILAVVWIVIPVLAKKKQQQAKEQAEREHAARQRAAQAAAMLQAERARSAAQQMRTTPLAPSVRPSQPSFQPSVEGVGSTEGTSGQVLEGELPHDVSTDLQEAKSSLTQIQATTQHTITASSESGHAHQETSMSGLDASCPPDGAAQQSASPVRSSAAESAFVWDQAGARTGLVMAEILGPCLALRE